MGQRKMMHCSTLVFALLGPLSVAGHGNLVWPPTWFDPEGKDGLMPGGVIYGENAPLQWFSNWTFIPRSRRRPLTPHCLLCRTFMVTPTKSGTRSVASFCRLSTTTSAGCGTPLTPQETRGWPQVLRPSSAPAVCGVETQRVAEGSPRTENAQEEAPAWVRIRETSHGITQ